MTQKEIAFKYKKSCETINKIIRNITYYDPNYTPPKPRGLRKFVYKLLNNDIVKDIRNSDLQQSDLAKKYDVSVNVIWKIINNIYFKDPDYDPNLRKLRIKKSNIKQSDAGHELFNVWR